jgi:hypothetical protein
MGAFETVLRLHNRDIDSGQCGHLTQHATQRIEFVVSHHQSGSISRLYNLHIFLVFIVRKSLDDISAEILARKYEPGTYIPVAKTFFLKSLYYHYSLF